MLGVGNGNVNEDQSAAAQGQFAGSTKPVKPKDWRVVLYFLAMAINGIKSIPFKKLIEKISPAAIIKKFPSKPKIKKELNKTDAPSTQPTSPEIKSTSALAQVDDDIEAWLNKISEKASQKSATAKTPSKSPVKKSAPVKKTTKRAATSKAKR
jgi:hypothetical protein